MLHQRGIKPTKAETTNTFNYSTTSTLRSTFFYALFTLDVCVRVNVNITVERLGMNKFSVSTFALLLTQY